MVRWGRRAGSYIAALVIVVSGSVLLSGPSASAASAKPKYGGTLTFAMSTLTPTLDPSKLEGGGTVGSIELQSIYSTLVTWNDATKTYDMGTAKSLVASDDFSVWTLTLRPGLKFTDGTPYDAAAVQYNIERDEAATSTASDKSLLVSFLKSMTVVNSTTLVFNLTEGWSTFPFILSDTAGQIASPTQIAKLGANFGATPSPAGAGPFMVQSYEPDVSLVVVRNPNYFGPKPYLNEIKFVASPLDPSVTEEDVKTGLFDAAYSINAPAVATAKSADLPIVSVQNWSGTSIAMNAASGPTANVSVRQAVAAAINPNVINERVYQGDLSVDTALVGPSSAYNPHIAGPKYNLSLAKKLVKQAKASDGFNGAITLLTGNDPVSENFGVAVKAMLDAAGFNVTVDSVPTGTLVAQILVSKTYQLALWSLAFDDADIYFRMFQSFSSQADRYGFSSPAMDAAINDLRLAGTPAKETAAIADISKIVNQEVPFLNLAWGERDVITTPQVHGIQTTSDQVVLLGRAWLS